MCMKAKIKAPSGKIEYSDIINYNDRHFNIRFMPTENGEHVVSVKQGQLHVAGSPFKVRVGKIETSGSKNIKVFGMGINNGYINSVNKFSIIVKDQESGKIIVSIDGPSKASIDLNESESGIYNVEYKMSKVGQYLCSVKFNDEHIHGSPFKIFIQEKKEEYIPSIDYNDMSIDTIQNQGIVIGRPTSFLLNSNGVHNNSLKAYMIAPSNKKEEITVKLLGNDKYTLRMEPKEKGLYKIYVLLNEKFIPGSPFEVLAGEVIASGKGLVKATVGKISSFIIDTKNAEPGTLTATIDGPSKMELNCLQIDDGYKFSYFPNSPGDHILAVKYKNTHIKGSPFKVNVRENKLKQRDSETKDTISSYLKSFPENVTCHGNGIFKADVGRNNKFIVDASLGGYGILYVGINGPSKPCDEINIKHLGNQIFEVNYFVHEYGKYLLFIRWNNQEITNSPFHIFVQ